MTLLRNRYDIRAVSAGLVATLLLSVSATALRAETSNAELAREIAELKSQIQAMKGALSQTRAETRKMARVRAPAPAYVLPPPSQPAFAAGVIPAGATPAFVTADKKLQFGPITITPGGFIAAESVFRSKTEQADITSNWQGIPFQGQAATNEYRLTARQTRIALLAEGAITPSFLAAGYVELDFLGAGITANANESNSYNPRIRHLYAQLDNSDYGMHVLAGQTWSLATMNSKGITPRNEVAPPTIDGQFVPGFVWKRETQIRLTKDFDKRLWLSLSAEGSGTTFGSPACGGGPNGAVTGLTTAAATGVNGVTCTIAGTGNLNPTVNYSLNHLPDVIGKVAYEARFAERDVHLEAFGIYRNLYDRVSYVGGNSSNQNTTGYGVGGGLIVPLLPRRLDFQVSGIIGRGVGSYGTSQNPDLTFNSNGSLRALRNANALAGFTLHATPSIDVYLFGGFERTERAYFANGAAITSTSAAAGQFSATGTGYTGYGVPNANNNGCAIPSATTFGGIAVSNLSCAGNTRAVYQGTAGMWDKLYKGAFGEVRVGLQYSYTRRDLFPTTFNTITSQPNANVHTVLTSFRYYPFQ